MAFKPWQFFYRPPKTVTAPVPEVTAGVSAGAVTPASSCEAARLMARLDELIKASDYLQSVILSRAKGLGIRLDPAVDTEVARALEILYGTETPPAAVTIDMYGRTLDAEFAALQVDMALPLDSPYEMNPFQTAAASTVNRFVETTLAESGNFEQSLPLLLNTLKGDAVVFQAVKEGLAQYPAVQTAGAVPRAPGTTPPAPIPARHLDISQPLAANLDGFIDTFSEQYASVYKLAATLGHIEAEAETIVSTYFMQPVEDVIRMLAILQNMKGLLHVPNLKGLVNAMGGIVLVRLASEASALMFQADRFMNLATNPLKSMLGTVGRALNMVQAIAVQAERLGQAVGGFAHTEGPLKGMSYSYDCGMPHNQNKPKPLKGLAGIDKAGNAVNKAFGGLEAVESKAMTSLASHLQWGLQAADRKMNQAGEAFQKLLGRRASDQSDQLDLLCSLQALDSLLTLGKAVIEVKQTGGIPGQSPVPQLQQVERILARGRDVRTETSPFVVQDGRFEAVPPDVPPVPLDVQPVLQRGGLDAVPTDVRDTQGVRV